LNEDNFIPEEDFEKENLDVISSLGKITDNISEDFENKLFNKIKSSPKSQKMSYWSLLVNKLKNNRMPMYLSYALLVACSLLLDIFS
jgi:hypothetical protein